MAGGVNNNMPVEAAHRPRAVSHAVSSVSRKGTSGVGICLHVAAGEFLALDLFLHFYPHFHPGMLNTTQTYPGVKVDK